MTDAIAFHNDAKLQEFVLQQVAAHTAADEIVQGQYWEGGKGCFIGCIAHDRSTDKVFIMTGFTLMLTRIAEITFEGLPNDIAKGFPQRVINAPRLGADLSLVAWKFLAETVEDALKLADADTREQCQSALYVVQAMARGDTVDPDFAKGAAGAAYAASGSRAAKYAAVYAVTAAAADDAILAAASAARSANRAAVDPAARITQADRLVRLLSEA